MRVRYGVVGVILLTGCGGLRDAFTSRVDVVARADGQELPVAKLAEIVATGKGLPIRRDVIERLALLWVEYALVANRMAAGDSLLDSALVLRAMWPEAQQRLADHFHDRLTALRATLDSAGVDSAYAAGDHRLVDHILITTNDEMAPDEKLAKRRKAEAIRDRLSRGGLWKAANEENEDAVTKAQGGRLGVFGRGEMVPAFENVAFALAPGELSGVTESPFGFHVLRRPPLREVRDEFRAGVLDRMVANLDSTYLNGLERKWNIRVQPAAAAAAREAAVDPVRGERSRKVIGTYRGGSFRVSDFVRWLRAMPPELQSQVGREKDNGRLEDFVRSLMRNQVLILDADSAGVRLTPADHAEFADGLRRQLALLTSTMRVDSKSLADSAATEQERRQLAGLRVEEYLGDLAGNRKRFMMVPPFLAQELRERSRWAIVPAGVERALERARTLRASIDSTAAASGRSARPGMVAPSTFDSARVEPLIPVPGDTGRPRAR